MSLADHHDIHGMGISCGDAEAQVLRLRDEVDRLTGNADILSASTIGEAYDRIEEIIRDRDEAREELAKAREALTRIAAEIPRLDGLEEERVAKGLEWIHQRACAALDAAPSAVEAPAPDQTRDETSEVAP